MSCLLGQFTFLDDGVNVLADILLRGVEELGDLLLRQPDVGAVEAHVDAGNAVVVLIQEELAVLRLLDGGFHGF